MDKDELIWVDKEFAEKWKALKTAQSTREQQEAVFNEYMNKVSEKVREDFKTSLDSLEEDAAMFTGLMLKVKKAFEKAKDEHLTASYDLWEKFENEIPPTKEKIDKIVNLLTPLEKQLNTINELLRKINTNDLNRFIESLALLSNTYGKNKEMVEFLVKHFGKTEIA